ncbi:MAG TPA: aldehyde dehydrogenase family protein [Chloroflexota bacterium]|nr:aldehyde dehydrogenase family protein [Chloroflexota bacterium]
MAWGPAPEAAAPALEWLERRQRRFGHFIDGAFVPARATFQTINLANRQPLADIAKGSEKDVDNAVQAARTALPGWSGTPGHVHARYLYALARQVQKHSRLLAVLESLDNGKPIRESRDLDIPAAKQRTSRTSGWSSPPPAANRAPATGSAGG